MPWHVHAQNLCERRRPGGRPHETEQAGPLWRHGRCWLTHYGAGAKEKEADGPGRRAVCLHLEWQLPSRHVGSSVTVHNTAEDDLSLHLGVGLVALWVGISGIFPARWRYRKDSQGHYVDARVSGVHVFDGALCWDIWHGSSSWSTRTPRWRAGSWRPLETLLGRTTYTTTHGETCQAIVPLPEGPTPATFTFERALWRRQRWPRWPFVRMVPCVNVQLDRPIAVPGKGESAWDCGDDAIHSMHFPAATLEEAIAHVVHEVLRTRLRHGGSLDWQPAQAAGVP